MVSTFFAGIAQSDLTPPLGVELAGFGYYLDRRCTGVLDPLQATALVWEHAGARGAIVACDLAWITGPHTHEVRRLVAAATGIPGEAILINCSHTHAGPCTFPHSTGWGEPDADYLATLPDRIAQAVISAAKTLHPVELAYGEAAVHDISFNRESRNDNLQAGLEYGNGTKSALDWETAPKIGFGGITCPTLKALKLTSGDKVLAVIAHYSCHPVTLCAENSLASGDFTSRAVRLVAERHGAVGMFLQGSTGDQDPVFCHDRDREIARRNHLTVSDRFAGFFEAALAAAKPVAAPTVVQAIVQPLRVPQRVPDRSLILRDRIMISDLSREFDQLPSHTQRRLRFDRAVIEGVLKRYDSPAGDAWPTEIQAVRWGDILFLAHPTELFYTFHEQIENQLGGEKLFLLGITNDALGYIPTDDRYDVTKGKYSYPANFVPLMLQQFPFQENVGMWLSEQLVALGKKIRS